MYVCPRPWSILFSVFTFSKIIAFGHFDIMMQGLIKISHVFDAMMFLMFSDVHDDGLISKDLFKRL
jgi:hypothetical protein